MKKEEQNPTKKEEVKKKRYSNGLPVFNFHAAGIDVGDTLYDVAISDGVDGHEVREYPTFTEDLNDLVSWLVSEGITTAAIESTGVYWLNLYLKLEEAGIEPYLANARYVKNVTGRKKDDTDAIWMQKLHTCGLIQKSFQPEEEIRELRTYVRQRKNLISIASDSVRRMQKALELMNIKVHTVLRDILGVTGLRIINALLNGEHNVDELIKLVDPRVKAKEQDLRKSLVGIFKDEYLFMLKQAYEEYVFYQSQISTCEEKIKEQLLKQVAKIMDGDIIDVTLKKKASKNQYSFDVQSLMKIIVGVDLCKLEGISGVSCLELISEIGTDMSKWKSSKHFAAWLNLVPNTKITGGKIISSRMQKRKNQAGQTLRVSANSLTKSKSPMGDYCRKMKSRLGKIGGVIATAHKLSKIIYTMIKEKREYDQNIIEDNQAKWKEKRIRFLEKQINQLKKAS